jgi:PAS domain S-box-containing protein
MLRIGLAQAEGIGTADVVDRVIEQCRRQMGGHRPQAGLVFAGGDFDHQHMLERIDTHYPGLHLIGCTSAGDFSSRCGFSDDSVSLVVFGSERLQTGIGSGSKASRDPVGAVQAAVHEARQTLDAAPTLAIVLPDGNLTTPEAVVTALGRELGPDCPLFGGCAGHLSALRQPTRQFCGTTVLSDGVVILLLAGAVDFRFSVANSWKPIGRRGRATAASGREVYRIGDRRALDFYRLYLGRHSVPATEFPLAVYEDGSDHFYLRGPILYNEQNGSVTFAESIPQGAVVQLTETNPDFILDDAGRAAGRLIADNSGKAPVLALAFSCVLRKEALGTRTGRELGLLRSILPKQTPVIGFYGFGEIAPLQHGQASRYYNAALVTVLLHTEEEVAVAEPEAGPFEKQDSDPSAALTCDQGPGRGAQEEIAFLRKKLARSEHYRMRLESSKERTAALHRQIISEVEEARREVERQQAALRKSEQKFRRIVEAAGEGFLLMDRELRITDVNEAFCRMIGFSRDDLTGLTPLDLATDESRQFLTANRHRLLESEYRRFECSLQAKNGRSVPVLVHGNTLFDARGELIGNMAFFADMTAQNNALLLAAEVQRSLLPQSSPLIAGLDVAGRSLPCEAIGGDYFDYLWGPEFPNGPLSLVIGDITGHGVEASLLMTTARAFLRMRASRPGTIAQIVGEMNRHLTLDIFETGRFMTLFYMTIDRESDQLSWVRAGHDPALIYDPHNDRFERLMGPGIALGLDENYRYRENRLKGLGDQGIVVLGTDGIWEAFNSDGRMFGKKRLHDVVRRNAEAPAADIVNAVFTALDRYARGQKPEDDATLVVVKFDGRASGKPLGQPEAGDLQSAVKRTG